VTPGVGPWPRGVVFDCDGVLIDSEACWHDAYRRVLEPHGARIGDGHRETLAGASVAGAAALLSEATGVPIAEARLRAALSAAFMRIGVRLLPGAGAVVRALAGVIPLAVATNGPLDVVESALRDVRLHDCFDAVVSAESAARHKPAPDVYLEACRRIGVHPSDAIAFEDSPRGVAAATAAGMVTVAVGSLAAKPVADLVVARLDDPRALELLAPATREPSGRADSAG
jgi:beta-phosphoglucomutase-like phosphatase (HAD superfamily)